MAATQIVKVRRINNGHGPWKMFVDDTQTNIIVIDEITMVRFEGEGTGLRIFVPDRGRQRKLDFIIDRGEGKDVDASVLAESLREEGTAPPRHHSFVIMALEDQSFVTGSTIPEFQTRE